METYRYKIVQTVEVEAFDPSDAWDAIQDEFGIGEQNGIVVVDCEYKELKPRKK
jgi:hypothetical protein